MQQAADFFLTIPDAAAASCMRTLTEGVGGDQPIVAGEAGVAGVAALLAALTWPEIKHQLQPNSASRVLLFNIEGATDPEIYQMIMSKATSALPVPAYTGES